MRQIEVLDCTLRDGGYCNKWRFGQENSRKIIKSLVAANIDYIECGFLTDKVEFDKDITKFPCVQDVSGILPVDNGDKPYLLMINFGEYDVNNLPLSKDTNIKGIRVAFHKHNRFKAIELCKKIKEKGYLVFVQPMVSMSYTAEEFEALIQDVNILRPYAFYIVDSFGMMKRNDLMQLVEITEKKLESGISLGFHAHNNLQLAYSNAQYLVESLSGRALIIDISIHGMGRGAGNLNGELFLEYLNEYMEKRYFVRPLLSVMDEIISRFYEEKQWGYSLPNYLSASHMIHPNYAAYLDDKKTLTLEAVDAIFDMVDPEKGLEYDEKYIEELYIEYLSRKKRDNSSLEELKRRVESKKILLIAPGRSVVEKKDTILEFIKKERPVVLSINHDYPYFESDYVFVSNMRRFVKLSKQIYKKVIITSNIRSSDTYACFEYYKLLNTVDSVRDNAGLMAIKFVAQMNVKEIYLAGYDGYSHDIYSNFETRDMTLINTIELLDKMNFGMKKVLEMFVQEYPIKFLTNSKVAPRESIS